MPATFARWESDLRSGRLTAQEMVVRYDGLRTLAVIWMLADRQGRDTAGLPTPTQIVALTVPDAAHAGPKGKRVGKYLRYDPAEVRRWFDELSDAA